MRRMRWLMLAFLAVMAFMAYQRQPSVAHAPMPRTTQSAPRVPSPPLEIPSVETPAVETPATESTAPNTTDDDGLPREVGETLALIHAGGPFPFDRDGIVFGNFEQRLPKRGRGWYHEYTVPTPGVEHRGARRIVTGGDPPSEFWYTDDHYESFRQIDGSRSP